MLHRREVLIAVIAASFGLGFGLREASPLLADDPQIRDVLTISTLPRTTAEMKDLHDRAKDYAPDLLPEYEPFEVTDFNRYLTKREEEEAKSKRLNMCGRRHAISVGIVLLAEDQKRLPMLSGSYILDYLKNHFVSLQARIYREPVSGALYLGPRCLAATKSTQAGTATTYFTPTIAEQVNNTRSLGLLLPAGTPPTPANLRTLVMIHKTQVLKKGTQTDNSRADYEYVFIRSREAGPDQLELHSFGTSEDRTKLHWLNRVEAPKAPSECSFRESVYFSEYSHQGLYPKTALVRDVQAACKKTIEWDKLDAFSQKSFGQPAIENMTRILDALMAGEIDER